MKRLLIAMAIASATAVIVAAGFIFVYDVGKADRNPKGRIRDANPVGKFVKAPDKNAEFDDDIWPDMNAALPPSGVKLPEKFSFKEAEASLSFSISQYKGDFPLQVDEFPPRGRLLTFVRIGAEPVIVRGHTGSVFRSEGNRLFFAFFSPSTLGCAIACIDLESGKKLWQTRLRAVGVFAHCGYRNEVTMDLSPDLLTITGAEDYGDYGEVLDRKTGRLLAHRIYREGFPLMSWQK